jgi:precorrin-2 methylase
LEIARPYLRNDAVVHPLPFPMTTDSDVLQSRWREAAQVVDAIVRGGEDCCFLTLGDGFVLDLRLPGPRLRHRSQTPIVIISIGVPSGGALTNSLSARQAAGDSIPAADDRRLGEG